MQQVDIRPHHQLIVPHSQLFHESPRDGDPFVFRLAGPEHDLQLQERPQTLDLVEVHARRPNPVKPAPLLHDTGRAERRCQDRPECSRIGRGAMTKFQGLGPALSARWYRINSP